MDFWTYWYDDKNNFSGKTTPLGNKGKNMASREQGMKAKQLRESNLKWRKQRNCEVSPLMTHFVYIEYDRLIIRKKVILHTRSMKKCWKVW